MESWINILHRITFSSAAGTRVSTCRPHLSSWIVRVRQCCVTPRNPASAGVYASILISSILKTPRQDHPARSNLPPSTSCHGRWICGFQAASTRYTIRFQLRVQNWTCRAHSPTSCNYHRHFMHRLGVRFAFSVYLYHFLRPSPNILYPQPLHRYTSLRYIFLDQSRNRQPNKQQRLEG